MHMPQLDSWAYLFVCNKHPFLKRRWVNFWLQPSQDRLLWPFCLLSLEATPATVLSPPVPASPSHVHFQPAVGPLEKASTCFAPTSHCKVPDGRAEPPAPGALFALRTGLRLPRPFWAQSRVGRVCLPPPRLPAASSAPSGVSAPSLRRGGVGGSREPGLWAAVLVLPPFGSRTAVKFDSPRF